MLKFIVEGIGILGMIIILLNLFLLETEHEKPRSKTYLTFGLVGATMLVSYSLLTHSYLFVLLNFVFVIVNGYWLITLHTRKNRRREKVKRRKKR